MKKLLSILGAATLMVSAPLSVVACNKKRRPSKEDEEFDFDRLRLELKEITQSIFSTNLQRDFKEYLFIKEEPSEGEENGIDYPFSMNKDQISSKKEKIMDTNSEEFKTMVEDIEKLVNKEAMNKEIQEKVVQNVNFRPVLANGASPLADGFQVESIKVEDKAKSTSLSIKFTAKMKYKDAAENIQFEALNPVYININIMEKEVGIEDINKFKNEYSKILKESANANSFIFASDSGNAGKNAERLIKRENNEIYKTLDNIFTDLNSKYTKEKLEVNMDYNLDVDPGVTLDGSVNYTNNNIYWNTSDNILKIVKAALMGDPESEAKMINEISMNKSKWVSANTANYVKNIDELTETHPGMSEAFNAYNLEYNYENQGNYFRSFIKGSEFKLEPDKEPDLIGLYIGEIKNIYLTLDDEKYELPVEYIVLKQKPKSETTLDLLRKFVQTAFDFNKMFYNFDENSTPENNPDYYFYLNRPENWSGIKPKEQFAYDQGFEDLLNANPKAKAKLDEMELTAGMSFNAFGAHSAMDYMSFNENDDVYFYRQIENQYFYPRLRIYFYSDSLFNKNGRYCFSLNYRQNFNITKVNESVSGWKFKK